ncbi:MAG: GNAT family N-acetyltransferase [Bryobacteraceae bacterium]|nr:GNAT family N-acetyltransferase [Bryobacteraceae bacterium]
MASTYAPVVRKAVRSDAQAIHTLVDALADYEKLERPTVEARARIVEDLFGPKPRLECWLAFLDGYPVGYAFALETYSSFLALPSLYLEDLFVLPEYRSRKAGLALFNEVLGEARRRGCGRMEWTVLDWNQLAIDFYQRLGATYMKEWHLYRIAL